MEWILLIFSHHNINPYATTKPMLQIEQVIPGFPSKEHCEEAARMVQRFEASGKIRGDTLYVKYMANCIRRK